MARKPKNADAVLQCLIEALEKTAGYGQKRIAEATDQYKRYSELYQVDGSGRDLATARADAMAQIMADMEAKATEKKAKLVINAEKISGFKVRLDEAAQIRTAWGKRDVLEYHALRTTVERDQRIASSENNFQSHYDVAEKRMWQMFSDMVDEFSKNFLGLRRGSVEDADIADAVISGKGSRVAQDIAKAIQQTEHYANSEMARNGVRIPYNPTHLPFSPVGAKLANMAEYIQDLNNHIDWVRSGGGRHVLPSERQEWLAEIAEAQRTGNWKNVKRPFEYTGGRFATEFMNDRMFQFKDGKSYSFMVNKYMDGGFYQTNVHRVQKLAHNIAATKIWGPSPSTMIETFKDMALRANQARLPAGSNAKALNKYLRRYDNMTDIVLQHNAMDPESRLGQFMTGVSNLMYSAMLNHMAFVSIPGDVATTLATRMTNHEPLMRFIPAYFDAFLRTGAARREMLKGAHAANEFIGHTLSNTRYGVGAEQAVGWTSWLADKTMRLNLATRGFDATRAADMRVRTMTLYEARNTSWNNLAFRDMLERSNFTEKEWAKTAEAMQKRVFSPADGVEAFRPFDYETELGSDLVHKWQRMLYHESRRSVIENSIEARVMLTGNTRKDTLVGAILASTATFHSFPVVQFLSMARTIMSADTRLGQVAHVARYGLTLMLAAAFSMQMVNLWNGKKLDDVTKAKFWLTAFGRSGAASLWGDYITGAMRADDRSSMIAQMAGPFAAFASDAIDTSLGSAYRFMDIGEKSHNWAASVEGIKFLDFLRKYMIPQPFFVAPVLQRNILEPFETWMNPAYMHQRFKSQRGYAAAAGTPYEPGTGPGFPVPLIPFTGGQ